MQRSIYPVFEFLLLAGVPPGDVLQVTGDPADLDDVVGAAFGADGLAAQGQVPDPGDHLVHAVAVVERAHDLELVSPQFGHGFWSTMRWQVWHLYLRRFPEYRRVSCIFL